MLTGPQSQTRKLIMRMNRSSDRDRVDPPIFQEVLIALGRHHAGIGAPDGCELGRIEVADPDNAGRRNASKIADEVRPPIAVSYDADADLPALHTASPPSRPQYPFDLRQASEPAHA